ncbi:MAG: tRNA (adenosine(37)-N6)-threonylcarbamoyltransferase complex dimerization subunit type 1 TsaB [Chloroflexota bacterium]
MELSIDTSTRYAGVGLSREGKAQAEYSWFSQQNHSVELLPAVEHLLKTTGTALQDLVCVFVATGPGGFSALRVGLSTAKGLGMSLEIPLVALPTLDIEAYPFQGLGMPICPLLDIGRGEVAVALYAGEEGRWSRLWEEQIVTPEELCSRIKDTTLFCGEGASSWASVLKEGLGEKAVVAEQSPPTRRPGSMAQMGYQRFQRGERDDISSLEPLYLRRPSITPPRRPT